ncbi:hypothetical protein FSP39_023046 [Pinctada imbricata]|uniref:VWFA domain-containing protein n=1 Tax=Pinctada imbricata TaxID=66713 RepID=A0AA89BZT0_PINIB|nr:hypothetical protein FSP39_023046 [Pinctada imbricata]
MLNNLVGILLRFRQEKVAITMDIEHMFYNFKVPLEQRRFLRFLWHRNNDFEQPLVAYQMTRHVFGNSTSPSVANFGLRKVVEGADSDVKCLINNNFYVDDGLLSYQTESNTIDLVLRTQKALQDNGRIRLHKFTSNSRQVLKMQDTVPLNACDPNDLSKDPKNLDLGIATLPTQRSLGLLWDTETDSFTYKVNRVEKPYTRRGLLSTINSVYDPLGFAQPVIIQGKLLLREMMSITSKTDLDDPLPELLHGKWVTWTNSLSHLESLNIPRMYSDISYKAATNREVLVFADASKDVIAAVAYLKLYDVNRSTLSFLMGKAKETVLVEFVFLVFQLNGTISVLKTIQQIATRCIDPSKLAESSWLNYMENTVELISEPEHCLIDPEHDQEIYPEVDTCTTYKCEIIDSSKPNARFCDIFSRFSSWNRLVRTVSRIKFWAAEHRKDADCSSLKTDIVFLLDASGSMSAQSFNRELAFVEDVIQRLPIGSRAVQVGFLAFSTNVYNTIYLNQYGDRKSLIAAIKQVRYSGGQTYTSKVLSVANTMVFTAVHGDRDDANNIIILLTDGISSTPRDTSHEVQLLRSRGIEMMVVAIGNNPGSEARTISSSGDLFTLSNFQGLNKSLTERLLDTMCDADCSNLKADLLFIVDASGSMKPAPFNRELSFVEDVIHSLSLGPETIQIGFMAFSTTVYNIINLNQFRDKKSLVSAIKQVQYSGLATYTSSALQQANTNIFTARHGDRNDAEDIIILLTDGISSTNTSREVHELRSRGIEIFVIAIGNSPKSEAHNIASTDEDVFTSLDFQGLNQSLAENLLYKLCDDDHKSLKRDLVFAIDRTNSVNSREYFNEKQFVNEIIKKLVIGPEDVQVSALTYPSSTPSFWLNTFNNVSNIVAAINNIPFIHYANGRSRLGGALALARTQAFQKGHGDRPDAPNMLIVITDGFAYDHSLMQQEAKLIHAEGVIVAAIGVGHARMSDLQEMVTAPSLVFHTNSFTSFGSLVERIVSLVSTGK